MNKLRRELKLKINLNNTCLYDAYEAVLGKGSYDKMLEALYHAFMEGRDKIMINEILEDLCVD